MERRTPSWVRLPRLILPKRAKDQVLASSSCGALDEESAAALALSSPLTRSMPLQPQVARLRRNKKADKCRYRSQLEQEVRKLEEQLQEEMDLHVALANAIRVNADSSSTSSLNLPDQARELVDNIITLETGVAKLEQEQSALHLCVARARYERQLHESDDTARDSFSDNSWEEQVSSLKAPVPLPPSNPSDSSREEEVEEGEEEDARVSTIDAPSLNAEGSLFRGRNLWRDPNKLSEEMVRCMRGIFLRLSSESPIGSASGGASDPYRVHGKTIFSSVREGAYGAATEVSWMVVGQKQLEFAAESLRIFRFLVGQLVKVNPEKMIGDKRLSFWINLYNALVMHAYLAYGVPRNDAKHLSLMQKVSYNVGGQSVSAADMEYDLLKTKPAAYRPHVASVFSAHNSTVSEEQKMSAVDCPEPLAMFGMSSGMFSSPAVRIFTEKGVKEELQTALRDYVRASAGIGLKGNLLVPKLVHCYAKAVGIEDSLLVDWICRYLSPEQASDVRNSSPASHRKQRLLGAPSFIVIPFDSRFRYLFITKDTTD